VILVAKLISNYQGYRTNKRREDDLLVRKKLMREVTKSKNYLNNIQNFVSKKDNNKEYNLVKSLIDKLDIFSNEIEFSISGHNYPFYSPQISVGIRKIKKLINYDFSIIENMCGINDTFRAIQNKINNEDGKNIAKELIETQKIFIELTNDYKNRNDLIKNIKL